MKNRLLGPSFLLTALLGLPAQGQPQSPPAAPPPPAAATSAGTASSRAPGTAESPGTTAAPNSAAASAAASAEPPTTTSALGAPGAPIANTINPLDLTNVRIGRVILGSGEPGSGPPGNEVATQVYEGLYHAPQYLPYYPTAATIWPRAIEVPCRRVGADLLCDRYFWRPEFGRAEYLFFTPVVVQAVPGVTPGAPGAEQQERAR